jgi:hypothetical protein
MKAFVLVWNVGIVSAAPVPAGVPVITAAPEECPDVETLEVSGVTELPGGVFRPLTIDGTEAELCVDEDGDTDVALGVFEGLTGPAW